MVREEEDREMDVAAEKQLEGELMAVCEEHGQMTG